MRVFVTGATGFIGSAVVQELIGAGHQVLGLARSDAAASALIDAGAEVHRGALDDLDSLRQGAAAADGVIHTAFIHDFSKFAANCETDSLAIGALGEALAGSGKPLVITAGIGIVSPGRLATEDDVASATSIPRIATERAAAALAEKGINVSVVRLPPSVHGDGDHGFVPTLINIARERSVSAYVGEGLNRWPAVHRFDAAHAFRLALEKGTPGSRFHAVADEGIPFREIAEAIGSGLNLPVVSISPAEAAAHFTWLEHFVQLNVPALSTQTQQWLGWAPVQPGLIPDLNQGRYFEN